MYTQYRYAHATRARAWSRSNNYTFAWMSNTFTYRCMFVRVRPHACHIYNCMCLCVDVLLPICWDRIAVMRIEHVCGNEWELSLWRAWRNDRRVGPIHWCRLTNSLTSGAVSRHARIQSSDAARRYSSAVDVWLIYPPTRKNILRVSFEDCAVFQLGILISEGAEPCPYCLVLAQFYYTKITKCNCCFCVQFILHPAPFPNLAGTLLWRA